MKKGDWFPTSRAGKFSMFTNFDAKIDNYAENFALTAQQLARLHLICQIFGEIHQKFDQNKAAMDNFTEWQNIVFKGTPRGNSIPTAPAFANINLPADSFIGIFDEFRETVNYLKNHLNYTENIGIDLMIVANDVADDDLNIIAPDIKITAKNDDSVEISFKKGNFDSIEIQYRKTGTEIWLNADKATFSPIVHKPQLTNPDQAEKFEYRAIYLRKNERVGNWSPIYAVTAG